MTALMTQDPATESAAADALPAVAPPNEAAAPDMRRPDPKLLELLVCPLTKTTLVYDSQKNELVSSAARLAFPIRDGIPIMLASEARALD